MELNPAVKAKAARIAIAKSARITKLGITPETDAEALDGIAFKLAVAKGLETECKVEEVIEGQTWYVNDLHEYSKLAPQERFQKEYDILIVESSSMEEIYTMIDNA